MKLKLPVVRRVSDYLAISTSRSRTLASQYVTSAARVLFTRADRADQRSVLPALLEGEVIFRLVYPYWFAALVTSLTVIRPSAPEPCTWERSTP
ncbi:MAG TPA: hypothetical protein VEY13_06340, partial [Rubrobacteraceae bacterium]|nr:hypothetical protein [Rubrobacteraceae bacterium]